MLDLGLKLAAKHDQGGGDPHPHHIMLTAAPSEPSVALYAPKRAGVRHSGNAARDTS
jgi:hypothetical protein